MERKNRETYQEITFEKLAIIYGISMAKLSNTPDSGKEIARIYQAVDSYLKDENAKAFYHEAGGMVRIETDKGNIVFAIPK